MISIENITDVDEVSKHFLEFAVVHDISVNINQVFARCYYLAESLVPFTFYEVPELAFVFDVLVIQILDPIGFNFVPNFVLLEFDLH